MISGVAEGWGVVRESSLNNFAREIALELHWQQQLGAAGCASQQLPAELVGYSGLGCGHGFCIPRGIDGSVRRTWPVTTLAGRRRGDVWSVYHAAHGDRHVYRIYGHEDMIRAGSSAITPYVRYEFISGRHFGLKGKTNAGTGIDITVCMYAAVDGHRGQWVQFNILIAEHAELENGDQIVVDLTLKVDLGPGGCLGGGRIQNVRCDTGNQAGKRPALDRHGAVGGIRVWNQCLIEAEPLVEQLSRIPCRDRIEFRGCWPGSFGKQVRKIVGHLFYARGCRIECLGALQIAAG